MDFRTQPSRLFNCLLVAGLCYVVMAAGCNRQAGPDYANLGLAEVSGTIRLDEKPLANAHVIFESPDETYSSGKTNSSGKYTLMFNSEQSGVLTGQKIVRIQLGGISEEGDDAETDGEGPTLETGLDSSELPSTYHRNSQLTATVIAGQHTINFDLKSDGSTTSASQ